MENQEENSVRPNDLLERSAVIEMGDDGVSITPEDDVLLPRGKPERASGGRFFDDDLRRSYDSILSDSGVL